MADDKIPVLSHKHPQPFHKETANDISKTTRKNNRHGIQPMFSHSPFICGISRTQEIFGYGNRTYPFNPANFYIYNILYTIARTLPIPALIFPAHISARCKMVGTGIFSPMAGKHQRCQA